MKKSIYKRLMENMVDEAPFSSPSQLPFSSPEAKKMVEQDVIKMGKMKKKASMKPSKGMGGY